MKIGLFFGSFNPIHTGHLIIANYVANYTVDKIWFIVSPQNPFKQSAELLNASKRLALVRLAVSNDERFEVLDIEFHLPTPSYTVDTLHLLSRQYPEHEFFLIIGSDNLQSFPGWKSSTEIINKYTLLVYERPRFSILNKDVRNNNIKFLNFPLLDISSTEIRELIAKNKSIRYLVPERVYEAIAANGYFK